MTHLLQPGSKGEEDDGWRKISQLIYNYVNQKVLDTPSLTCDWLPRSLLFEYKL